MFLLSDGTCGPAVCVLTHTCSQLRKEIQVASIEHQETAQSSGWGCRHSEVGNFPQLVIPANYPHLQFLQKEFLPFSFCQPPPATQKSLTWLGCDYPKVTPLPSISLLEKMRTTHMKRGCHQLLCISQRGYLISAKQVYQP